MPLRPQRHHLSQSPLSHHPQVFQLHQFGVQQLRPPMAKPPPNLRCRDPLPPRNPHVVKQLFQEFTSYSAEEKEGKRVVVGFNSRFTEQAFNMIVETIKGKQFYGEKMMEVEDGRKFRGVIREGSLLLEVSCFLDVFPELGWMDFTGIKRRMVNATREGGELVQRLIDNHQKRRVKQAKEEGFYSSSSTTKPGDQNTLIVVLLPLKRTQPEDHKVHDHDIITGLLGVPPLSVSVSVSALLLQ